MSLKVSMDASIQHLMKQPKPFMLFFKLGLMPGGITKCESEKTNLFTSEDWLVNIDILKRQSLVVVKDSRYYLACPYMNKYVEWLANQGTVQSDEVDSLLIDYFTQICRSLLRDHQKGKEGLRLTLVKHELNILACIQRIC
jgi:hypothetical protein